MARPLHRWKSFWLGILVLVFLGWAWGRSMGHRDEIIYETAAWEVTSVIHTDGKVTLSRFTECPRVTPGLHAHTRAGGVRKSWFPRGEWIPGQSGKRSTEIGIPHWLIILGFLLPWAGFLVWRVRRVKRLGGSIPFPEN